MVGVMGFLRKAEHDTWVDPGCGGGGGRITRSAHLGKDSLSPLASDGYGESLHMEE